MNEITDVSGDEVPRDESKDEKDEVLVLGKASESTEGLPWGFFGDGGTGWVWP